MKCWVACQPTACAVYAVGSAQHLAEGLALLTLVQVVPPIPRHPDGGDGAQAESQRVRQGPYWWVGAAGTRDMD
jgi:hypothetical protein